MNGKIATYRLRIVATIGILVMLLAIPARGVEAHGSRYNVTDLGTLGGPNSFANAINNRGQIVGSADTTTPDASTTCAGLPANASPEFHAFLWQNGVMQDLRPYGGDPDSVANAISDGGQDDRGQNQSGQDNRGQVAGNSGPLCISLEAILWQNGTPTNLGTLSKGGPSHFANGINNRGQVVGASDTNIPDIQFGGVQTHAFLWEKGVMSDLGTLGGPLSFANGINDPGQVVGTAFTTIPDLEFGGLQTHAFLWQKGHLSDLGTLGGANSVALSINDRTQVAGQAYNTTLDPSAPPPGPGLHPSPEFHGFLWQRGVMRELPPYTGDPDAVALGINNQGQVVGGSGNFFQPFRAVLWQDRTAIDLNTLIPANSGWHLLQANGINAQGQIVGYGMNPAGHFRGFLLTPAESDDSPAPGASSPGSNAPLRLAPLPAHVTATLHWGRSGLDKSGTP